MEIRFIFISFLLVLFGVDVGECGDYCSWYENGYFKSEYCRYGCCDDDDGIGYQCCGVGVALIVGAVIGGLAFLAFIIFVVVCLYMQKKKRSQGRVMAVPGQTNIVTYTTTTVGAVPQPTPYQQTQPYPNAPGTNYYSQQYSTAHPSAYPPPTYPPPSASTTTNPLNPAYAPPPGVYSTDGKH